jgi:hypothetical protein
MQPGNTVCDTIIQAAATSPRRCRCISACMLYWLRQPHPSAATSKQPLHAPVHNNANFACDTPYGVPCLVSLGLDGTKSPHTPCSSHLAAWMCSTSHVHPRVERRMHSGIGGKSSTKPYPKGHPTALLCTARVATLSTHTLIPHTLRSPDRCPATTSTSSIHTSAHTPTSPSIHNDSCCPIKWLDYVFAIMQWQNSVQKQL